MNDIVLKNAVDEAMLLASRKIVVLETLDGKSKDYTRGLLDGMRLESDFLTVFLTSAVNMALKALE
jgi:hypothetical protein